MVIGKNTLTGLVLPQQHLGMIHAEWKALDRPMPFALALGTEPAIPFVSGMPLDKYVNEADFIGGYFGEPVDVVDCETVDLFIPRSVARRRTGRRAPATELISSSLAQGNPGRGHSRWDAFRVRCTVIDSPASVRTEGAARPTRY